MNFKIKKKPRIRLIECIYEFITRLKLECKLWYKISVNGDSVRLLYLSIHFCKVHLSGWRYEFSNSLVTYLTEKNSSSCTKLKLAIPYKRDLKCVMRYVLNLKVFAMKVCETA